MSGPPRDLAGRCAIVTGAGKGLGRAYALHLAARGAAVLVNNRRYPGEADADTSASRTVDAIRAAGGTAHPDWCDVDDPDSGVRMVEAALGRLGGLDVVVANAGVDRAGLLRNQTLAEFRAIFDVGFLGTLHLVHAAWPRLVGQGYGRVLLTTSSAGLYGNRGQAAYSAAKGAVIGLMRALALEGRRNGVRVNAISPYGHSQMTAPYMDAEAAARFDPARVAPLVGWLCSEACDLSGEVLVCGGGALRRATPMETAAVPLDPDDPRASVAALADRTARTWDSAADSFDALVAQIRAFEASPPH